jgi:histidinol dehydrogenase
MNDILTSGPAIEAFLKRLEERVPGEDAAVAGAVRSVVDGVRARGRAAILDYRSQFESVGLQEPLIFGEAALAEAKRRSGSCAPEVLSALRVSIERVRAYHRIQIDESRSLREARSGGAATDPEGCFTSRVQPLDSVAVYVPGGKAFYPSSVIMSVVPAQVAGVGRVAVVTPFRSLAHPTFLATIELLGISEVLATGGAQGVAAAAFGCEGFLRCDKIVGPGNVYVATAKHLLSGRIGIDSFAGPSEILVLSDGSSPLEWVVADLLAQAEHDEEASSVLITTSAKEAEQVQARVLQAIEELGDRAEVARTSWRRYGAIAVVPDRDALLMWANRIHSEHLHVHTACALTPEGRAFWVQSLKGVGAVFLGRYCAEVFGDYLAGPSHVLPTAGTARFASPLGVYDFVRRSSVLWMNEALSSHLSGPAEQIARAEELWGHARAAALRSAGHEAKIRSGGEA